MRTTMTIADDLADALKARAGRLNRPFKEVVNEALRLGLDQLDAPRPRRFRSKPVRMGVRPGVNFDNIGTLLAGAEGEDFR